MQTQDAHAALGPVVVAEPNNLETAVMLPNEEEEHDRLGALLRRHYGASEPTDRFGATAKPTGWSAATPRPTVADHGSVGGKTASPWNRITRWNGRLTMRQRIAVLGSIGVAALLGFFLLWRKLASNRYRQWKRWRRRCEKQGRTSLQRSTKVLSPSSRAIHRERMKAGRPSTGEHRTPHALSVSRHSRSPRWSRTRLR